MSTESFSHAVRLYNSRTYAAYPQDCTRSSAGNPAAPPSDPNARVTTDGSITHSSDPSTDPQASIGHKLKGNVLGAVKETVSSIQGETGMVLRNKRLEEKGLERCKTKIEG